ncbi:sensor domain-containing diguanylate cyclase [Thiocystis violacea]|uniref:sensor domain-containing diguanylate cyclase n=1 Tax=Thiocystis violacea TaxID=13725 RepID=UPI00190761D6|nr:GGDEF domain-containing protein [Thiocystis violacea]
MNSSHSMDDHLREENATLRLRLSVLEASLAETRPSPAAALRIDKLLDNLPGMVYRCRDDPDWTMEYVSVGARELLACSPDDLLQNRISYAGLILHEDRQGVWDEIQQALALERRFELRYRVQVRDGAIKWVWERGWGVWSDSGELIALEGFITDITDTKQAEHALLESERRYRRIVENSQEGIWTIDAEQRTNFVNARMAEMLGYPVEEMLGRSLLEFMSEEFRGIALNQIQQRRQGTREPHDFPLQRKDGGEIWALMSTTPLLDEKGRHRGTLAMVVDITDRKRMEARLRELAISDPLTGLLNRRHFYELAQRELERFTRYRRPLAAIMADLDHFKSINDEQGHLIGDQVLQTVARMLSESMRQTDLLCRYGGEEFAMLLPETDIRTASLTAERLRAMFDTQPIDTERGPLRLTVSLGVAAISAGETISLETLLDNADRMLYAAKDGGRNQVAIWDLSSNRKVLAKPPG